MARAVTQFRGRLLEMGGAVYQSQTTCPITSGQVGIWLDSTGTFQCRNADGTDSRVATEAQGPFYVAVTKTSAVLANSPVYANGTLGVGATLTAGSNVAIGTVGGVALTTVGQIVLVTEQASTFQNGLYSITVVGGSAPWKLTRLPGFDTAATILDGAIVAVQQGTSADLIYSQTATVALVGTDAITFSLSSTAVTFTAVQTALAAATGSVSLNGQKISSLANPTANNDAANKSYVDNRYSFSNSNNIAFGTNGSTVTASATPQQVRYFENQGMEALVAGPTVTGSGAINLSLQRISVPVGISATRFDLLAALSAVASTHISYTLSVAAYTFGVSTASSASSTSVGVTANSSAMSNYNSTRYRSIPLATWNLTPGEYLFGVMASVNGPAGTTGSFSFYGGSSLSIQAAEGPSGNYSAYFGNGIYSAATGAFPASIHMSDVNQTGASVLAQPYFRMLATG